MLVRRVAPFGDDALPPFAAGALPRLRIVERRHAANSGFRSGSASSNARRASSGNERHVASVEPEDVEDVIADARAIPR